MQLPAIPNPKKYCACMQCATHPASPTPNKSLKEIEKENCFVVSLKNKDTNEIEKELATSKKNAKISEVHHTTATTGKIKK